MLTQTASPSTSRGLIRILGVGFGLAVIVGSTLGIGILRTPGLVAGQLPNSTAILTVWIVGGLYTLVGAICLAELGTMLPEAGGYYVYARRAFGNGVGFAVGWTDWLTYCAVLGYVSIAIGEFAPLLLPSLAGHERAIAILSLAALAALQLAGLAGQQPLSGNHDGRQMRRVPDRRRRGDGVRARHSRRIGIGAAGAVADRADRGAPVGRDYLRRMAERAVFFRGGPRSGSQPSAGDDRRRRGGDCRLPARERRVVVGAAARRSRALDVARRRRGADSARRPRPRDHHDPVDRLAAADAQRHPDDRHPDPVRDGAGRTAVAASGLGDRSRNAGRRHAGDDGGGAGAHRHRHVSAAGRGRGVLPGRQLRRLLPRADRAAPPRAGPDAAVSRVGLPVVGRHRPRRRCRLPRRRRGRRHGQRGWRAGAAGAGIR